MSVAGLCAICERKEARFSCNRCGSVVCEDHYVERRGICSTCGSDMEGSDHSAIW